MKLTDDKIRWIIRRKIDGSMTTKQIAEAQGVDQSRVRQLWLEFRNNGKVPTLKPAVLKGLSANGRKTKCWKHSLHVHQTR
ncbi:MAG: hypothetical protein JRN26_04925 [Nitrososphaerota archaeon]|jgi:hypothetical protein|nr:hypothetical protein [Nitrososphaerota archaeon]MDG6927550.1 hypothetical protein [Nitrososphaerota archaeon]MDG6930144.1 hypothetical protein [Nitrososphaerota archaeon]MDG6932512.1 hypothetical protein [Nitrososphaerota archaeon]MDG6936207.1 hypothetical protein [Nitrososphaerota archaeon]